jgi:Uncharacterized protein conserved in bacteria (DUF2059)
MPVRLTLAALAALALSVSLVPPLAPAAPAAAQALPADPARSAALADLIGMDAIFAVMSEEGRAYGADIAQNMFPGRGEARWSAAVSAIYDPVRMADRFDAAFAEGIAGDAEAMAAAEAFFGGDLGREILQLELEARRALMDDAVEEAAKVAAEKMQEDRDPRLRLIRDLIEAGDLIEMNVAGALTASLAFTRGMAEAAEGGIPLDEMMSGVWAQESAIRADSGAWLLSYMGLAYGPLSDDDLRAYIAFSRSEEGQRVNAALFSAFDAVFTPISYDLGRAAARHATSDDI